MKLSYSRVISLLYLHYFTTDQSYFRDFLFLVCFNLSSISKKKKNEKVKKEKKQKKK